MQLSVIQIAGLAVLGAVAGTASGLLGIGGAVIMIPALVLIFGFSQETAQGTTLFLMVFPIGILAVIEYYKAGKVNLIAGAIIAVFFVLGGWIGGKLAIGMDGTLLRKLFAGFLVLIALRMFFQK
jgi:uncharacterized membrane protein YfcA